MFNQMSRSNSEKSKEEARRRRYDALNGSQDSVPYRIGDRVKYKNLYLTRWNRRFSAKFRGPYEVLARKGVNYRIGGGANKSRWVHHDELSPWKASSQVLSSPDDPRSAAGSEGRSVDVREDFFDSETSSAESDDSDGVAGPSGSGEAMVRVPRRTRQPPIRMRDYYVGL